MTRCKPRPLHRAFESLEPRIQLTASVESWDLNRISANASPRDFAEVNGTVYFTAQDDQHGFELWRTDGSDSGTSLVFDLFPGSESSLPQDLTNINGKLFFSAVGSVGAGRELWTSDGTADGTIQLSDLLPGKSIGSDPTSFIDWNGRLLYVIDSSKYGFTTGMLGVSDGTVAGTGSLSGFSDFRGVGPAAPSLIWYDERIFSSTGHYYEINGDNLVPQPLGFGFNYLSFDPGRFQEFQGRLYHSVGRDGLTSPIAVTRPGLLAISRDNMNNYSVSQLHIATDLQVDTLTAAGNHLFFTADKRLWSSDGTTTFPLTSVPNDMSRSQLAEVNGLLYFVGGDGELWKSDGTVEGTNRVKDIRVGVLESSPQQLTNVNGTLVFSADDGVEGAELWRSDGTANGTVPIRQIRAGVRGGSPNEFANLAGTLYFRANDGAAGYEVWKSDLTEAGTQLVSDVARKTADSAPAYLVNFAGTLFFSANDGVHGRELWKQEPNSAPSLVADLRDGAASSTPREMTVVGNGVVFSAEGDEGRELWWSDGTDVLLLSDIWPGPQGSDPTQMTVMGNAVYFTANDGLHGVELWKTDGTTIGTVMVADLFEGGVSSNIRDLLVMGDHLYFNADPRFEGWLWRTDGTPEGTRALTLNRFLGLAAFAGQIYGITTVTVPLRSLAGVTWVEYDTGGRFVQFQTNGRDLDIRTDWGIPPQLLTDVNGIAYFAASAGTGVGLELWRSDGTTQGTFLVRDIVPGDVPSRPGTPISSAPTYLTNVNGTLFFAADDERGLRSLWMSDGSSNGTVLIKSFTQSDYSLYDLRNIEGTLYFTANDGESGLELWRSDGTTEGTQPLVDVNPGRADANPIELVSVGSALYFSAVDQLLGTELRRLRITPAGDFNGDGRVDPSDAELMFEQWGTNGAADLNRDGIVDALDAGILFGNWTVE